MAGGTQVMWGSYARDLLVAEGEPASGFIDLRAMAARVLRRSAGGIDGGARAFSVLEPTSGARAQKRIAVLRGILAHLLALS
ncbi:MAG TPA: hypothetical protein VGO62_20140 [Myxococcota bacterium]